MRGTNKMEEQNNPKVIICILSINTCINKNAIITKNTKFTGARNPNFCDNHATAFENILISISIILPSIHVTEFATFSFDCFIFFIHKKNDIKEHTINITLNVTDIFFHLYLFFLVIDLINNIENIIFTIYFIERIGFK